MRFSRQEYWSGLPFPPPEDLPNTGIEPMSFLFPVLASSFFTSSATWKADKETPIAKMEILGKPVSMSSQWTSSPFSTRGMRAKFVFINCCLCLFHNHAFVPHMAEPI